MKEKKTLPQCSDNGCGAHAVISAQLGGQRSPLPARRQRRGTRDVTSAVLTAAGGRAAPAALLSPPDTHGAASYQPHASSN